MQTETLTVANEIARQIGDQSFYMMGTRYKVGDSSSLTFDIRGCARWNKVKVTLDFATDTYSIEFFKIRGVSVRSESFCGIYADRLQATIETETGLRLSL